MALEYGTATSSATPSPPPEQELSMSVAPDPEAPAAREGPCIVITYGWCLGTPGGVARHIQELSRHLGMAGAKVIIVCVEAAGYTRFPRPALDAAHLGIDIAHELASVGVEVVRVPPHPLHWTLDGRPVRRAVQRILDERRVDAVLGFYNEAAYLPALLRARGVVFGYIATWLSYRMAFSPARTGRGVRGALHRWANQRFIARPYREAQVLFANSNFTRGELIDVIGCEADRIRVTNLGVHPKFGDVPRDKPRTIKRFLFFGRLVPEKGIIDALEALAKVKARGHDNWTYRVIGSGAHTHVRRVADRLGIGEEVELAHHADDEELREELRRAHVALMPSHSESFGLSIAEANAAGLPVIAYQAGSVPEVIEDGVTGWLAPLHDIDGLAARIEAAIEDPEAVHRAGLAGRRRVLERFRWERTAQLVMDGVREAQRG